MKNQKKYHISQKIGPRICWDCILNDRQINGPTIIKIAAAEYYVILDAE